MLSHDPKNTRIANGFTIAGRTSCWLTPDQLLIVEQQLVTEDYRRFDLRHVQALVLYRTRIGNVCTWLLGLATALFGTYALITARMNGLLDGAIGTESLWVLVPAGVAALLGLSLVFHLFRGPTARLQLRTAVQTLNVPGVNRWRAGLKMLTAVEAAARQAQTQPADAEAPG